MSEVVDERAKPDRFPAENRCAKAARPGTFGA